MMYGRRDQTRSNPVDFRRVLDSRRGILPRFAAGIGLTRTPRLHGRSLTPILAFGANRSRSKRKRPHVVGVSVNLHMGGA